MIKGKALMIIWMLNEKQRMGYKKLNNAFVNKLPFKLSVLIFLNGQLLLITERC